MWSRRPSPPGRGLRADEALVGELCGADAHLRLDLYRYLCRHGGTDSLVHRLACVACGKRESGRGGEE